MGNLLYAATKQQDFSNRPTIGFLNMDVRHEWALWPWQGVMDAAAAHQVNLVSLIGQIIARPEEFSEQANVLYALADARRLDGVIIWKAGLVSVLSEQESNAFCQRFGLPVVTIEGEAPGMPCVTYSNYDGMQHLVTHLIETHGYRRIGFVGMLEHHAGFQARYQAYCDTLHAHGLVVEPAWTQPWFPDSANRNGYIDDTLFLAYLRRALKAGVDALAGVSDTTAIQLLKSLRALNVRVPHDVAVIGFDGFTEGRAMTPPITTVDPGWYQLGWQAMTTMMQMLAGESVPLRVTVPARVLIRQSCGCMDSAFTLAARPPSTSVRKIDVLSHDDMTQFVQETLDAMTREGLDQIDRNALTSLMSAFQSDVTGHSSGRFLLELDALIQADIDAMKEVSAWHDMLSLFREQVGASFAARSATLRADALWQQARILISHSTHRAEMFRRLQAERQAAVLREIGQALITAFDVAEIMDILASKLPLIAIPRCYVVTFEQPQTYQYPSPAPEWARLRLAYDTRGRLALPKDGWLFPSWQITPPEILPVDAPCHLLAQALYVKDEQIGYVLFEPGPRDGYIYDALRGQISSALQGALLVQRVQERSAEIARQKYVLETFMANVPDNIYFKDRDSRFTHANTALAACFGVNDPQVLLGKNDFDFFPAEQARLKYEAEQEIIRTGEPILALEEPEAGGRWALTTKMPLRDEHGKIIGTFGISHNITDVKQAQLELAAAYEEIKLLNTRLHSENLRMSAELNAARRVQQMVLPMSKELKTIPGLEIVGYMQPADEVGGDYYDVLKTSDAIYIGIGDVTGHGLESGVLMLMTQTAIRTLVYRGETDPVVFLNTINRVLHQNIQRIGIDRSLSLAVVRYQEGELRLIGQHEETLIVRRNGRIERIDTTDLGFPLGMVDDIREWVDEATITLDVGDGVVLYTDGITEAQNAANEFYGIERLCAVISAAWRDSTSEAVKEAIIQDWREFVGEAVVYDDVTLVILKQQER